MIGIATAMLLEGLAALESDPELRARWRKVFPAAGSVAAIWLTLADARNLYAARATTVRGFVRSGEVRGARVGRDLLVHAADLAQAIERRAVQPTAVTTANTLCLVAMPYRQPGPIGRTNRLPLWAHLALKRAALWGALGMTGFLIWWFLAPPFYDPRYSAHDAGAETSVASDRNARRGADDAGM